MAANPDARVMSAVLIMFCWGCWHLRHWNNPRRSCKKGT